MALGAAVSGRARLDRADVVRWSATQQVVNQVGGAAGSITAGQVITTDLPVPSCALWFSGAREDSVNLLTAARIDSSAATLECWMKMSAAAGVAAARQTLLAVEELGDLAPQFAYAGNDALKLLLARHFVPVRLIPGRCPTGRG